MTSPDSSSAGMRIVRATVYFDNESGAIVHVHRIAAADADEIDENRIQEEVDAFEEYLERRHQRPLGRIIVDDEALREAVSPDVNLRVDVATHALVRE